MDVKDIHRSFIPLRLFSYSNDINHFVQKTITFMSTGKSIILQQF